MQGGTLETQAKDLPPRRIKCTEASASRLMSLFHAALLTLEYVREIPPPEIFPKEEEDESTES